MDACAREQGWVPQVAGTEGPIYLAIADAIGAAVAKGELRAGEQLPTHRALADVLGVDLTTATRAYAEARRRGLLQATVGRGTFVRRPAQAMPARPRGQEVGRKGMQDGPVDLAMNLPPLPADLPLESILQQGLSRLLHGGGTAELLTYRSGCGTAEERAAGASWLRPVLGEVDPDRVLVCPGAQPALAAALGTLAGHGDVVLTEAITYSGIRGAAAQSGVRLVGVTSDAEGLVPEAVEEACRKLRPRALYCVPTIHNPTTVTMPLERRRAIAEVAQRHGLVIVEDDAYGLLPSVPLPAIASFAPELGYYVATVSKVLSPALRAAYLVVPDVRAAARLGAALRANVLMASPLLTGLMTAWVGDGTASTVASAIRRESAARQRIAREVLPAGSFDAHPEGLHLWLRLPPRWNRRDFVARLRHQDGLAVVPSDAFAIGAAALLPDAVRVSLGAAFDRAGLREALQAVAASLQDEMPAFSEVV